MKKLLLARNPLLVTVATFSVLFGISGLEHGLFELLQGNAVPSGVLISAIGPEHRFWPHGTETALTLIPHMAISGCVAMAFSSAVILWSLLALRKRHAWIILLVLSIAQFLTGGGFAQIFLSVTISVVACRLHQPLSWWKDHIPKAIRITIAAPWMVLYTAFIILFAWAIEMAVFGVPLGRSRPEVAYRIMNILSYVMIAVFALTIVSGLSRQSIEE